jgi:glycine cleavage system H protein
MRYYSEDHVWLELQVDSATLGLSRHAVTELGELTFVELPTPGSRCARGDVLCVVESRKTAADVCSPVGGTVVAANELLHEQPGLVNASPEAAGWICRLTDIAAVDLTALLSPAQYEALVARQT